MVSFGEFATGNIIGVSLLIGSFLRLFMATIIRIHNEDVVCVHLGIGKVNSLWHIEVPIYYKILVTIWLFL